VRQPRDERLQHHRRCGYHRTDLAVTSWQTRLQAAALRRHEPDVPADIARWTHYGIKQPDQAWLMKQFLRSLLSARGRLNRIGFFHTFIFMMCLFMLVTILDREYISHSDGALTGYLYFTGLQSMLLLAVWTPSIIKRLHDLGRNGWFACVPWCAVLLDTRNLILIDIHSAAWIEQYQSLLFMIYAITMTFYLALFMMRGSDSVNRWGKAEEE
jgi:uncharacterized membrane protein YhaH (DUF805 family)